MTIRYTQSELEFKHPFTISKGTKTHQPALLVELGHFALRGYGEAPAISYYNISVQDMIADIDRKKVFLEKFAFSDPERYWHYLHHLYPKDPFLVCALDMAAWDIYGKIKQAPLYKLWKLEMVHAPLTDLTIGIDTPENMIRRIHENPWPIYKIKVGMPGDIELIKTIRKETGSVLRVDANGGWTYDEAMEKLPILADLGIELVEQPITPSSPEEMKRLFADSPLPLIADESCVAEEHVLKCVGMFHGVNIKLTKCGGITPARRMIDKARELGLSVMLGCMNESAIGSAALVHLAPLCDHLDVDGPLLLAEDNASGISYDAGKVRPSGMPGLGITLKPGIFV